MESSKAENNKDDPARASGDPQLRTREDYLLMRLEGFRTAVSNRCKSANRLLFVAYVLVVLTFLHDQEVPFNIGVIGADITIPPQDIYVAVAALMFVLYALMLIDFVLANRAENKIVQDSKNLRELNEHSQEYRLSERTLQLPGVSGVILGLIRGIALDPYSNRITSRFRYALLIARYSAVSSFLAMVLCAPFAVIFITGVDASIQIEKALLSLLVVFIAVYAGLFPFIRLYRNKGETEGSDAPDPSGQDSD
ncbi:MAG: hypothetical protein DRP45_09515 [Candidatus Zixiibacteriota bacterium]|nr:MAG: hypothetical protein DRP45_09515 [candidate division Zixibacteria bacterium]